MAKVAMHSYDGPPWRLQPNGNLTVSLALCPAQATQRAHNFRVALFSQVCSTTYVIGASARSSFSMEHFEVSASEKLLEKAKPKTYNLIHIHVWVTVEPTDKFTFGCKS